MKKILKLHKDMQLFIVFGGYMRNSKGRDGYVNKTLSAAERTFLRRYAGTGSLTEALAKSGGLGADGPEELLERPEAKRYLAKCRQSQQKLKIQNARCALARMAFGSVNDAVKLLGREEPLSQEELSGLDLFSVSEIRQVKGGGMEIKFSNRLDAIKLLWELEQQESAGQEMSRFISAVEGAGNEAD